MFDRKKIHDEIIYRLSNMETFLKWQSGRGLNDDCKAAEDVVAHFLGSLCEWTLVNLNTIRPNYPAADLGDTKARVAVQVTVNGTAKKIRDTHAGAIKHNLAQDFDRLVILFLLPKAPKPPQPSDTFTPCLKPKIEIWARPAINRLLDKLTLDRLREVRAILRKEMSGVDRLLAVPLGHPAAHPAGSEGGRPLPVRWNAPLEADELLGRDAFIGQVLVTWEAHRRVVLTGSGGMGKTGVAARVLRLLEPAPGNAARAHERLLLHDYYIRPAHVDALQSLCREAGHDPAGLSAEDAENVLLAEFARPGTRLYLEGCEKAEDLSALLRLVGGARVLLTSRNPLPPDKCRRLELPPLSPEDGGKVIAHHAGHASPGADFTELARQLGSHALCCVQAGKLLHATSKSPALLRADVEKHGLAPLGSAEHEHECIHLLLRRTHEALAEKHPLAAPLWHLLALGSLAPLPLGLLVDFAGEEEKAVEGTLLALQKLGVARSSPAPTSDLAHEDSAWSLQHAHHQHFGLRDLPPLVPDLDPDALYHHWRDGWIVYLRKCWEDGSLPGGGPRLAALLPHFEALLAALDTREAPNEFIRVKATDYVAEQEKRHGLHFLAEPRYRQNAEWCARRFGPEGGHTLVSRNNLANALQEMGNYVEAEVEHRAVLAVRERVLGAEHRLTLGSRNNLGLALSEQGKHVEAEVEHRAVLAVEERMLGVEHSDTLRCRVNLANALRAQGKHEEVEAEYRALGAVMTRVLGAEHPDTLATRNNLAAVLQAQGKNAEAEAENRAVITFRERVLGAEHPGTLGSRNNLAIALRAQGNHAEAETELRAVLAIPQRLLGAEHPDALASRNNLAAALQAQGKIEEAETENRAVIAFRERVLGAEHPDTLGSHFNRAFNLHALDRPEEALAEAEAAYAGMRKALGDGHPDTAKAKRLVEVLAAAE